MSFTDHAIDWDTITWFWWKLAEGMIAITPIIVVMALVITVFYFIARPR